jgi:hypothetical protein
MGCIANEYCSEISKLLLINERQLELNWLETTANTESTLAAEVTWQVLPSAMIDAMENSDLLNQLPDNEDGLRQLRNLFKTLDTLALHLA